MAYLICTSMKIFVFSPAFIHFLLGLVSYLVFSFTYRWLGTSSSQNKTLNVTESRKLVVKSLREAEACFARVITNQPGSASFVICVTIQLKMNTYFFMDLKQLFMGSQVTGLARLYLTCLQLKTTILSISRLCGLSCLFHFQLP